MEIKTIEDVNRERLFGNSDFSSIIESSLKAIDLNKIRFNREMDIGDVPISPMCIEDDLTPILLSLNVMDEYRKLIDLINKPETALEYGFVLLGKKGKLGEDDCYIIDQMINCNTDNLSNNVCEIDSDKLNKAIQTGIKDGYNFISLCHTHPKVPDDVRESSVASVLDEETRKSEFIRGAGLNYSLQDFITYESLFRYFFYRPNIRTAQTVIMYNGEIAMTSKQNAELRRFPIIMDATTGEAIYVSSKEEYLEEHKIN